MAQRLYAPTGLGSAPGLHSRCLTASAPQFSAPPGHIHRDARPAKPARPKAAVSSSDSPLPAPPPASEPLGFPGLIFPALAWSWQRAPPKDSLTKLPWPQDKTAAAWILNVIELVHWASFPLGFFVAHFMFVNAAAIAPHVGGDLTRVFLLVLGLLCQVFGGGIAGNMMHVYEGWQVTPFRNPLALPNPAGPGEVDQIRVDTHNNAWLRAVAYQMLFLFQSFGQACFSAAVFGINPCTTLLIVGTAIIGVLGPHEPRPDFTVTIDGLPRPVLPLSWSLLFVFALNVVVDLVANSVLFTPAVRALWPCPPGSVIPADSWMLALVPLVAPLLLAAGGAIEGGVAESTFNQWYHLLSFVILLLGLGLTGVFYKVLLMA